MGSIFYFNKNVQDHAEKSDFNQKVEDSKLKSELE